MNGLSRACTTMAGMVYSCSSITMVLCERCTEALGILVSLSRCMPMSQIQQASTIPSQEQHQELHVVIDQASRSSSAKSIGIVLDRCCARPTLCCPGPLETYPASISRCSPKQQLLYNAAVLHLLCVYNYSAYC